MIYLDISHVGVKISVARAVLSYLLAAICDNQTILHAILSVTTT